MDITALCDICGGKNGAVFSVDIALAHHFVAPHPPLPSYPIEVLVVLATQVKKTIKNCRQFSYITVQCTVDIMKYLE